MRVDLGEGVVVDNTTGFREHAVRGAGNNSRRFIFSTALYFFTKGVFPDDVFNTGKLETTSDRTNFKWESFSFILNLYKKLLTNFYHRKFTILQTVKGFVLSSLE